MSRTITLSFITYIKKKKRAYLETGRSIPFRRIRATRVVFGFSIKSASSGLSAFRKKNVCTKVRAFPAPCSWNRAPTKLRKHLAATPCSPGFFVKPCGTYQLVNLSYCDILFCVCLQKEVNIQLVANA